MITNISSILVEFSIIISVQSEFDEIYAAIHGGMLGSEMSDDGAPVHPGRTGGDVRLVCALVAGEETVELDSVGIPAVAAVESSFVEGLDDVSSLRNCFI